MVHIELYGVPRLRAGTDTLTVRAETLGEALTELRRACPGLPDAFAPGPSGSSGHSDVGQSSVVPQYLVSINGAHFADDPATRLNDGDVLVIVSAQAGG